MHDVVLHAPSSREVAVPLPTHMASETGTNNMHCLRTSPRFSTCSTRASTSSSHALRRSGGRAGAAPAAPAAGSAHSPGSVSSVHTTRLWLPCALPPPSGLPPASQRSNSQ
jgi:hypothetical protein